MTSFDLKPIGSDKALVDTLQKNGETKIGVVVPYVDHEMPLPYSSIQNFLVGLMLGSLRLAL